MDLRRAARLAAASGVLLLLANASGGSLVLVVGDQLARAFLPPALAAPVHLAVALLLFVAGFGGLAVLAGAALFWRGVPRGGSLLVVLGAGSGLLGLAVMVAMSLASGQALGLLGWLLGPAGLGVVLSILARRAAA